LLIQDYIEAVIEFSFKNVKVLLTNFIGHTVILISLTINKLATVHEVVDAVLESWLEVLLLYLVEVDVYI
jgi:hypothetical protein